jgi:hypothetical protein
MYNRAIRHFFPKSEGTPLGGTLLLLRPSEAALFVPGQTNAHECGRLSRSGTCKNLANQHSQPFTEVLQI